MSGQAEDGRDSSEEFQDTVRGERSVAAVSSVRNVHSRVSSALAVGLMSALGLGMLTWYYANALTSQSRAQQNARATAAGRAQGEMTLPSLGRIDPPASAAETAVSREEKSPLVAATVPPERMDIPLQEAREGSSVSPPYGAVAYGAAPAKTPWEVALERRLAGAAFSHSSEGYARWSGGPGHEAMPVSGTRQGLSTFNPAGLDGTSEGTPGMAADDGKTRLGLPAGSSPQPSESTAPSSVEGRGMLTSLPPPHITPAAEARLLPARRLLLPKGAFIDCTLETAIDSTLPGMTTCITATDTFGVDGQVVLLERGTKLVGETRGQVQQGSARIFVLWSEARTPTGVVVPLDSPGADELGRSGLRGTVSRHFWERFGAAILISTIDGAVQSAVHGANRGGGAVIYNPSSSQDIMTEVLKSTVNIPPTVVKHNGDRIQVLVARDLDFRPVYDLRAASGR